MLELYNPMEQKKKTSEPKILHKQSFRTH